MSLIIEEKDSKSLDDFSPEETTDNEPELNTIPREDEMNKPINPECIKNYYRE